MNQPEALGQPARRATLQRLGLGGLAIAALATQTACGFKLRNRFDMAFRTVQLTGFAANSPLASELARALEASGVTVVDSTLTAMQAASSATVPITHIVIEGLRDKRDMVVASTTTYSQVRTMSVRNFLTFRVKRGDGTTLIPSSEVVLSRDLTYNEADALAKQDEADALHQAMQSDIVQQVMRRLSTIRTEQLLTPVAPAAAASSVSAVEQAAEQAAAQAGAASQPAR
jgi:LPS-assembly lipoprotein